MTDVGALADALLTGAEDALGDAGRPVPERRYRHVGEVAFDIPCEGLAVTLASVYRGRPGFQSLDPVKCNDALTYDFTVTLWRCVPALDQQGIPSAAELDASAVDLMADAAALASALLMGKVAWPDTCVVVGFGPLTPTGPSGAATGLSFTVAVQP